MNYKLYKNKSGVTLVEVIVVIGIFSIITFGANWLIVNSLRSNTVIWEQLATQSEGRKVLKQVVNEIRKAEESSVGSFPIVIAGDNELAVYANTDSDSLRERIRFWLDGTTLKRGIIKPSGNPLSYTQTESVVEIAHDVKNIEQGVPVFYYYDESYTGTEDALISPVSLTDIHVIRVQLELEKDPTKTPVPLHVESVLHIRNLKTN
ncbi:type II secretion system protein [Candidatus Parcubacteria bacterium]|jgi:prepilin-type N-terminal cleavage/methylation domain-containing protein|nr:type II secretion system protein [Candidatus Parcubacteria bacterium]MBT3948485.1 type II secretion system protein [Candidatus Parcubacteria bacterium]